MFLGFILFYKRKGSKPLIADQWVGTEPGGRGLSSAGSAFAAAPPAENCRERRAHSMRVSGGGAKPMTVWKKPLWAGRTPTRSNGWLRSPGGRAVLRRPGSLSEDRRMTQHFRCKGRSWLAWKRPHGGTVSRPQGCGGGGLHYCVK